VTEPLTLVALVALIALVAQTGALFFWGGRLAQNVQQLNNLIVDHEQRLRSLELGK
jgi:hypothetical protein